MTAQGQNTMISPEELDRIKSMADEYVNPPHPRDGHQTIALYDKLNETVMQNLAGLLEAAARGVRYPT